MKENIIQFDSYLLCNLIMSGADLFDGHFRSSQTNLLTKAEIEVSITEEQPICTIPWHRKIVLSSRFLNRPFRIAHPALRDHSFVIGRFSLKEPLRSAKVPLLYKMLYKIGINA